MKKDIEKIKLLLPHWIKHNEEHTDEYKRWLERIRKDVSKDMVKNMEKAIQLMEESNKYLKSTLDEMKKKAANSS
ncbi:hypothetical protein J7J45_00810 [Candidatus Aerophobetes bacterium]|nr:hypothetical protein [Candidatus Aerophobetes bacterium]